MTDRPRLVAAIGALALVYFLSARFGLSLVAVGTVAASVWPPTGIALAVLVLYGFRLWPGIALGAFLVNWSIGVPAPAALVIAGGNTLEAIVGARLLLRAGFQPGLQRARDVLNLAVLAACLSTVISATIG